MVVDLGEFTGGVPQVGDREAAAGHGLSGVGGPAGGGCAKGVGLGRPGCHAGGGVNVVCPAVVTAAGTVWGGPQV